MPDVQTGAPYVASVRITDGNGSPVESGVSGTLKLYGPASNSLLLSSALADPADHIGDGEWAQEIPGSYIDRDGRYRWVYESLSYGATTLADVDGVFTAGEVPPEHKTLREIIVAVAVGMGGYHGRTTNTGTTATLRDTFFAQASGLADNQFVGSDLLILEPAAVADANPLRCTGFTASTGTFAFSPSVAGNVASGIDWLLVNRRGAGKPYRQLRQAIDKAIAHLALRADLSDETTLVTEWNTRDYTLPASWLGVRRVQVRSSEAASAPYYDDIAPHYWEYRADRRTLHLHPTFAPGYQLRLEGMVAVPEPRRLNDLVQIDYTAIADFVEGFFGLAESQRAGLLIGRSSSARWRGI